MDTPLAPHVKKARGTARARNESIKTGPVIALACVRRRNLPVGWHRGLEAKVKKQNRLWHSPAYVDAIFPLVGTSAVESFEVCMRGLIEEALSLIKKYRAASK